jgi:hypothetical protein
MNDHFEDRFASAFQRARKNFHKASKKNMTAVARGADYKEEILKLNNDFKEKYNKVEKSGSAEGLKSFKFLSMLGQGAFGVVVRLSLFKITKLFRDIN